MAPKRAPSDYDKAAEEFYQAGRIAYGNLEKRNDDFSPSSPNNPAAWDQSYKADPALLGSPFTRELGTADYHYYFGWDDAFQIWPNRGWRSSLGRREYFPPIVVDGVRNERAYKLHWLYKNSWRGGIGPSYVVGSDPEMEKLLTLQEIQWEMDQGRQDRAKGTTPPLNGYREPADAGIVGKVVKPAPVTPSPPSDGAPYAGFDIEAVRRYRPRPLLPFGFGQGLGRLSDVRSLFRGRRF